MSVPAGGTAQVGAELSVPELGREAWLLSYHLTPHRKWDLHRDGISQLELAPEALSLHWLVIHNTAALWIMVGRLVFSLR